MNRKIDIFLSKENKWRDEFELLRALALETGLTEDLKWGQPCYTLDGANIFLIHGFKEYCAILFFKGALMKDAKNLLIQQTANVQSSRQLRFKSVAEISKAKKTIKSYLLEAIRIEEAGLKVEFKKPAEFVISKEITVAFKKIPGLTVAFKKLTPGRQRGYILHFSTAKQVKTLEARIAKCAPGILAGKGLNE
ncbi:MAG: DUF1801 domain-containing protein [Actinomycetes bacterium]